SGLGIHGLLLGEWEHGPTWHIDPDGHVHTDPAPATADDGLSLPRMCTVPVHTARDLLTLHALAHPTAADAQPVHNHTSPPADFRQPGPAPPPRVPPAAADRSGAVLRVRLLGPVTVTTTVGGPPAPVQLERRRRAALQILVMLALHPDGATSTDL